ncbi:class I SAM-dependent methyltransferase [Allokutzneria albata]|uniref:Methyltransferase domain-containing protein n=1 Tax=Allokutzneria albata TaxID=211114 RepID=A0A1G9TD16_ALLAB|nr:class I SAM-dependent methyltransferase [Allokutzneria albata]SDM45528.1 Methyltransferase domain-containing protein [Allokutzneria albata]
MHPIANTEQAAVWNGYDGTHWADNHARYDAVNSGFNDAVLDAAAIGARNRVLDVGCGAGQLTRLAARRASAGAAVGIDLSEAMLRRAAELATEPTAHFVRGDAHVHPFADAEFDVVISRFGVMFFADPVAAFGNIGRSLRPGGRLAVLSVRGLGDLESVLGAPMRPMPLSDPDSIREVLSGFVDVDVTAVDAPQVWGRDAIDAADFLCGWGPVRARAAAMRQDIIRALRRFEEPDAVRLRGTAWLTTATKPV